ncbi:DUF924 family protein [Legionella sp.]|uniref:DUF924 family protein n=1 Tax=Legionella sp. TaxID=459 RepID=UPI000CB096C1|nr:DUF924 family protein [Legionella sp.]PJE06988.1 MAG: hypothetical protein CK430_14485 [Legionella sp.]
MIPELNSSFSEILNFWFAPESKRYWFAKNKKFDNLIKDKFLIIYQDACSDKLDFWKKTPDGMLSLIIIFDQFPRNFFRGSPQAFATDLKALNLAKLAIEQSMDKKLSTDEKRHFMYMPFMHSENIADQELSLRLFNHAKSATKHYNIIKKFGRFSHRNKILNRSSTSEEIIFLAKPYSSF